MKLELYSPSVAQTLQSPLYVTLLSGSAVAFVDGDFGSLSSVSNHSPVVIATVITISDRSAEIPDVIPNPPPFPPDPPQQQQDITKSPPFGASPIVRG